jgi:putative pyruvate formate lyase activating enzyme
VDRAAGKIGFCGESAVCRIASSGPHFGEELCFSGTHGSGTIFFSGCSSQCFFCQNYQISIEHQGRTVSDDELYDLARKMIHAGVHNINFVTPDHFWPHVEQLCRRLRAEGEDLPFLFNSSGLQEPELVPLYTDCMDIFLPDFKFADADLAFACTRYRRYPEITMAALRLMVAAKGFLEPWDPENGVIAKRGVLVRHLVLPGYVQNSLDVLKWLRTEFGPLLPISVMSQFMPVERCIERKHLDRALTAEEYRRVCDAVKELGFRHVFLQPYSGDPDFMPDFERDEPFAGNTKRRQQGVS